MLTFLEYLTQKERQKLAWEKAKFQGKSPEVVDQRPVSYSDFGHSKRDIVRLWVYDPESGELQVSKNLPGHIVYHGDVFKSINWNRAFAGRYNAASKILSVSMPFVGDDIKGVLQHELLPLLHKKFDFRKYYIF